MSRIERIARKALLASLLVALIAVIVLVVGVSARADSPSCWFFEDFNGTCTNWSEPGDPNGSWPYADFLFGWPGTSWGGEADGNLNLSFLEPATTDAGWAWGPFYCPVNPGQIINISVDMRVEAFGSGGGGAIGLFAEDSEPISYGGGMWYDHSVYIGSNGYILNATCPFVANFIALGVDYEDAVSNVYTYDTSGPHADDCGAWGGWLWEGVWPDNLWHNYAISFHVDTGDAYCYWDGEYMGIVHADDMANQNLYFQLYGIGVTNNIIYWDNFLLDSGDGSPQFSSDGKPLAPTGLLVDNISDTCMYNATPNMSCIAWHSTGTMMNYQHIMVATDTTFNNKVWDSGLVHISDLYSGQRYSTTYNGSPLVWNTKYYWRTRFVDCEGVVGDWSATSWFVYGVLGCGTHSDEPHGIFPPSDIDAYSTDCSPSIFLQESWEAGAEAMGFTCPRTFEQMVLGIMSIAVGLAAFIAVGHFWVAVLAILLWFSGWSGAGVYPVWMVVIIAMFLLSIWFTLRRAGV